MSEKQRLESIINKLAIENANLTLTKIALEIENEELKKLIEKENDN